MRQLTLFFQGRAIPITLPIFTIGRGCNEPDLIIDERHVSRRHALIKREGDSYLLQDFNSTHGTLHNGVRISTKLIEEGDTFVIGGQALRFSYQTEPSWK